MIWQAVSDVYVDRTAPQIWPFVSLHAVPILTFLFAYSMQHSLSLETLCFPATQ